MNDYDDIDDDDDDDDDEDDDDDDGGGGGGGAHARRCVYVATELRLIAHFGGL